jgi:predicted RND superfamily exporter protein
MFAIDKIKNLIQGSSMRDSSLLQGERLLAFSKKNLRDEEKHMGLIQQGSSNEIGSIQEAMEDHDSIQPRVAAGKENPLITKIEDEFNDTLQHYTTLYNELMKDLIQKDKAQQEVQQYFGKVVKTEKGDYYYVNNYGYKQGYSTESWTANSKTCPSKPISITNDDIEKLPNGYMMDVGQACNVSGKNIKNKDNGEIAWVDIRGVKHPYENNVWQYKKGSCNMEPVLLESDEYNGVPLGVPMNATSECDRLGLNDNVWDKLVGLNDKLITLSKQLVIEIGKIGIEDGLLKKAAQEKEKKVEQYIKDLEKDKMELDKAHGRMSTIGGERDVSEKVVNNRFMALIFWAILAVVVIFTVFHSFLGGSNQMVQNVILVVVALMLIYFLIQYIMKNGNRTM